ncbi:MAG: hypothetical protein ACFFDN_19925 [Candidatus Hodarchaeota archaeon]
MNIWKTPHPIYMTMNKIHLSYKLHPRQHEIFSHPAKRKVVPKGRRFGLTNGYAIHTMDSMFDGLTPILWVDTINSNIDRYVERYFYPVLNKLPPNMWKWRQQKKELSIYLGNTTTKCDFRSADNPENIEGFAYRLILLNEGGIILKDRSLWFNSIYPMVMDYDPVVIIGGTPKGQNLFFELRSKGMDTTANPDWYTFCPHSDTRERPHFWSYDNPMLDKQVIDDLADDMPEIVRKQEIFAEFLENEALVFRNIHACMGAHPQEPRDKEMYYAGLDLAKHVDFTVLIILNAHGQMVYMKRFNKLDWPYQKTFIIDTIRKYNDAKLLLDSTGVGDPIYDDLIAARLRVEGYKFTSESKKKLIENLMLAFDKEEILIFDDPILVNELMAFTYEINESGRVKYSAPEGMHDDTVISLALAKWCHAYHRLSVYSGFSKEAVY